VTSAHHEAEFIRVGNENCHLFDACGIVNYAFDEINAVSDLLHHASLGSSAVLVASFTHPSSRFPATWGANGPGEVLLRKPITGIAFCCARRAPGAVIALPRKNSSSRRLIG